MSCHAVAIRLAFSANPNTTIGHDPPLCTYFLHAFENPETNDPGLLLGAKLEQYRDLSYLINAAEAKGFNIDELVTGPLPTQRASWMRHRFISRAAERASGPAPPTPSRRKAWYSRQIRRSPGARLQTSDWAIADARPSWRAKGIPAPSSALIPLAEARPTSINPQGVRYACACGRLDKPAR